MSNSSSSCAKNPFSGSAHQPPPPPRRDGEITSSPEPFLAPKCASFPSAFLTHHDRNHTANLNRFCRELFSIQRPHHVYFLKRPRTSMTSAASPPLSSSSSPTPSPSPLIGDTFCDFAVSQSLESLQTPIRTLSLFTTAFFQCSNRFMKMILLGFAAAFIFSLILPSTVTVGSGSVVSFAAASTLATISDGVALCDTSIVSTARTYIVNSNDEYFRTMYTRLCFFQDEVRFISNPSSIPVKNANIMIIDTRTNALVINLNLGVGSAITIIGHQPFNVNDPTPLTLVATTSFANGARMIIENSVFGKLQSGARLSACSRLLISKSQFTELYLQPTGSFQSSSKFSLRHSQVLAKIGVSQSYAMRVAATLVDSDFEIFNTNITGDVQAALYFENVASSFSSRHGQGNTINITASTLSIRTTTAVMNLGWASDDIKQFVLGFFPALPTAPFSSSYLGFGTFLNLIGNTFSTSVLNSNIPLICCTSSGALVSHDASNKGAGGRLLFGTTILHHKSSSPALPRDIILANSDNGLQSGTVEVLGSQLVFKNYQNLLSIEVSHIVAVALKNPTFLVDVSCRVGFIAYNSTSTYPTTNSVVYVLGANVMIDRPYFNTVAPGALGGVAGTGITFALNNIDMRASTIAFGNLTLDRFDFRGTGFVSNGSTLLIRNLTMPALDIAFRLETGATASLTRSAFTTSGLTIEGAIGSGANLVVENNTITHSASHALTVDSTLSIDAGGTLSIVSNTLACAAIASAYSIQWLGTVTAGEVLVANNKATRGGLNFGGKFTSSETFLNISANTINPSMATSTFIFRMSGSIQNGAKVYHDEFNKYTGSRPFSVSLPRTLASTVTESANIYFIVGSSSALGSFTFNGIPSSLDVKYNNSVLAFVNNIAVTGAVSISVDRPQALNILLRTVTISTTLTFATVASTNTVFHAEDVTVTGLTTLSGSISSGTSIAFLRLAASNSIEVALSSSCQLASTCLIAFWQSTATHSASLVRFTMSIGAYTHIDFHSCTFSTGDNEGAHVITFSTTNPTSTASLSILHCTFTCKDTWPGQANANALDMSSSNFYGGVEIRRSIFTGDGIKATLGSGSMKFLFVFSNQIDQGSYDGAALSSANALQCGNTCKGFGCGAVGGGNVDNVGVLSSCGTSVRRCASYDSTFRSITSETIPANAATVKSCMGLPNVDAKIAASPIYATRNEIRIQFAGNAHAAAKSLTFGQVVAGALTALSVEPAICRDRRDRLLSLRTLGRYKSSRASLINPTPTRYSLYPANSDVFNVPALSPSVLNTNLFSSIVVCGGSALVPSIALSAASLEMGSFEFPENYTESDWHRRRECFITEPVSPSPTLTRSVEMVETRTVTETNQFVTQSIPKTRTLMPGETTVPPTTTVTTSTITTTAPPTTSSTMMKTTTTATNPPESSTNDQSGAAPTDVLTTTTVTNDSDDSASSSSAISSAPPDSDATTISPRPTTILPLTTTNPMTGDDVSSATTGDRTESTTSIPTTNSGEDTEPINSSAETSGGGGGGNADSSLSSTSTTLDSGDSSATTAVQPPTTDFDTTTESNNHPSPTTPTIIVSTTVDPPETLPPSPPPPSCRPVSMAAVLNMVPANLTFYVDDFKTTDSTTGTATLSASFCSKTAKNPNGDGGAFPTPMTNNVTDFTAIEPWLSPPFNLTRRANAKANFTTTTTAAAYDDGEDNNNHDNNADGEDGNDDDDEENNKVVVLALLTAKFEWQSSNCLTMRINVPTAQLPILHLDAVGEDREEKARRAIAGAVMAGSVANYGFCPLSDPLTDEGLAADFAASRLLSLTLLPADMRPAAEEDGSGWGGGGMASAEYRVYNSTTFAGIGFALMDAQSIAVLAQSRCAPRPIQGRFRATGLINPITFWEDKRQEGGASGAVVGSLATLAVVGLFFFIASFVRGVVLHRSGRFHDDTEGLVRTSVWVLTKRSLARFRFGLWVIMLLCLHPGAAFVSVRLLASPHYAHMPTAAVDKALGAIGLAFFVVCVLIGIPALLALFATSAWYPLKPNVTAAAIRKARLDLSGGAGMVTKAQFVNGGVARLERHKANVDEDDDDTDEGKAGLLKMLLATLNQFILFFVSPTGLFRTHEVGEALSPIATWRLNQKPIKYYMWSMLPFASGLVNALLLGSYETEAVVAPQPMMRLGGLGDTNADADATTCTALFAVSAAFHFFLLVVCIVLRPHTIRAQAALQALSLAGTTAALAMMAAAASSVEDVFAANDASVVSKTTLSHHSSSVVDVSLFITALEALYYILMALTLLRLLLELWLLYLSDDFKKAVASHSSEQYRWRCVGLCDTRASSLLANKKKLKDSSSSSPLSSSADCDEEMIEGAAVPLLVFASNNEEALFTSTKAPKKTSATAKGNFTTASILINDDDDVSAYQPIRLVSVESDARSAGPPKMQKETSVADAIAGVIAHSETFTSSSLSSSSSSSSSDHLFSSSEDESVPNASATTSQSKDVPHSVPNRNHQKPAAGVTVPGITNSVRTATGVAAAAPTAAVSGAKASHRKSKDSLRSSNTSSSSLSFSSSSSDFDDSSSSSAPSNASFV